LKRPEGFFLVQIANLQANFYTAFHSNWAGERECGPPITRKMITPSSVSLGAPSKLMSSGGPTESGRKAGGATVVPAASAADQELAWQHGRAYFRFTDRRGSG
jgi:hypothetical protein